MTTDVERANMLTDEIFRVAKSHWCKKFGSPEDAKSAIKDATGKSLLGIDFEARAPEGYASLEKYHRAIYEKAYIEIGERLEVKIAEGYPDIWISLNSLERSRC
jgi:hypothetical protein